MSQIGNRIRTLRDMRGWTVRHLAGKAKMSFVSISRYENGTVKPTKQSIRKLADALNITIDDLVGIPSLENPKISAQFDHKKFESKISKARSLNEPLKIELGMIIDRFFQNQMLTEYYSKTQTTHTPISFD